MRRKGLLKKVLATGLVLTLAVGSMTGCGGNSSGKGSAKSNGKKISIYAQTNGLGREWLENAAKAYEDKVGTKVTVEFDTYISENIKTTLEQQKAEAADIYFVQGGTWKTLLRNGLIEDMTEFLDEKGEDGKSLNEKMNCTKKYINDNDGNQKQAYVPVTNAPQGIVYNKKMMSYVCQDVLGWDAEHKYPVNTKELNEVIDAVQKIVKEGKNKELFTYKQNGKEMEVKPFVWSGSTGMLGFFTDAWRRQYWGEENYTKFYSQYENCDMLNDEVQYVIYQELVDMLQLEQDSNGDYVSNTSVPNCVSLNHTSSQSQFLMNYALMCPTGSWFYTEMKATVTDEDNLGFMPIPYLSDDEGNPLTAKGVEMPKDENGNYTNYYMPNVEDYFIIPSAIADDNKTEAKNFLRFMFDDSYLPTLEEDLQSPLCFNFDDSSVKKGSWFGEVSNLMNTCVNGDIYTGEILEEYSKIGFYNNPNIDPAARLAISSFGSSQKWIDSATGKEIADRNKATGVAVTENVYNYVYNNYKELEANWSTIKKFVEENR